MSKKTNKLRVDTNIQKVVPVGEVEPTKTTNISKNPMMIGSLSILLNLLTTKRWVGNRINRTLTVPRIWRESKAWLMNWNDSLWMTCKVGSIWSLLINNRVRTSQSLTPLSMGKVIITRVRSTIIIAITRGLEGRGLVLELKRVIRRCCNNTSQQKMFLRTFTKCSNRRTLNRSSNRRRINWEGRDWRKNIRSRKSLMKMRGTTKMMIRVKWWRRAMKWFRRRMWGGERKLNWRIWIMNMMGKMRRIMKWGASISLLLYYEIHLFYF